MGIFNEILVRLSAWGGYSLLRWFAVYEREYLAGCEERGMETAARGPHRGEERILRAKRGIRAATREAAKSQTPASVLAFLRDGMLAPLYLYQVARGVKKSYATLALNPPVADTTDTARVPAGLDFYRKLEGRARRYGIDLLGYTEVPPESIFAGKTVLFRGALVCAQELKGPAVETAPKLPAAMETLRVYAKLGIALNRLARFIRTQGIPCQACHPMMGLVLYPALAAKAGLGGFGRQGMLLTPEFGARQRIGAILMPLSDMPVAHVRSAEHAWISDYCDRCNLCVRLCPGRAILETAVPNVPGVLTCIDNLKCMPWFSLNFGCSICLKVCPFSQGGYDRLRAGRALEQ